MENETVTVYRGSFECAKRGTVTIGAWDATEAKALEYVDRYRKIGGENKRSNPCLESKTVAVYDWPIKSGVTVDLSEGYGGAMFIWHTGMSEKELVSWWNKQSSVRYLLGEKGKCNLPGRLSEAWLDGDVTKGVFSYGADGKTEIFILWPKDKWVAHLNADADENSCLKPPNKKLIRFPKP